MKRIDVIVVMYCFLMALVYMLLLNFGFDINFGFLSIPAVESWSKYFLCRSCGEFMVYINTFLYAPMVVILYCVISVKYINDYSLLKRVVIYLASIGLSVKYVYFGVGSVDNHSPAWAALLNFIVSNDYIYISFMAGIYVASAGMVALSIKLVFGSKEMNRGR